MSEKILCFGEIVWDALPGGIFLGGAPLNVAYHLHCLGREALPVSRIGKDFLGRETSRRLQAKGVPVRQLQESSEAETGAVVVELNAAGDARYEILENAAWDEIEAGRELLEEAESAGALVYGTLSTRSATNRKTLAALLGKVPVRLCDVNLRAPYDATDNALEWASRATVVKLNEEELDKLTRLSPTESLEGKLRDLSDRTGVATIVVTRGDKGALLLQEEKVYEGLAPHVEVADTVGAGDAFTAAFLDAYLNKVSPLEGLRRALSIGAHVASRSGAQPDYDPADVVGG